MKIAYTKNTQINNMCVYKKYVLQKNFVVQNISKVVKYFTNQHKKDSNLQIVVDYYSINEIVVCLVDYREVALQFGNGWVNSAFTNEVVGVRLPRNYKNVLLNFCK